MAERRLLGTISTTDECSRSVSVAQPPLLRRSYGICKVDAICRPGCTRYKTWLNCLAFGLSVLFGNDDDWLAIPYGMDIHMDMDMDMDMAI
jgi:hypothetical protein